MTYNKKTPISVLTARQKCKSPNNLQSWESNAQGGPNSPSAPSGRCDNPNRGRVLRQIFMTGILSCSCFVFSYTLASPWMCSALALQGCGSISAPHYTSTLVREHENIQLFQCGRCFLNHELIVEILLDDQEAFELRIIPRDRVRNSVPLGVHNAQIPKLPSDKSSDDCQYKVRHDL